MDIKVLNREQDTLRFVLSDVSPAFANAIRRIILAEGQRVKLEAYARLGRGRDHAKWQPASACTYSYDEKLRTFNFLVESTGTLPPEKLVLEAARLINGKTLGFEEGLGAVVEK